MQEAGQKQQSMRRHLHFEVEGAYKKSIGNNDNSWNSINIVPNVRTPSSPMGLEATGLFHANSYTISNNKQAANFSPYSPSGSSFCQLEMLETHTNNVDTSVRNNRSSSMPSGIGLHLNSIVSNCGSNTQLARKDSFNSSREKILSGNKQPMLEDSEGWLVEYEKQMPISQDAYRLEEFNQRSPKKKRNRDNNTFENEGCKRCNCRKTKCLKLYCDCFNAGEYCTEPCTCKNCFNRPVYEDTVLDIRQQIESRNSLAFAPKIVQCGQESPQNSGEDSNQKTPASARHKRGCTCKKSRCLKKYCECYKVGVGCSSECRCEGCKNVFGKKEEMEHIKLGDKRWEDASDGKMRIDISQPEQSHSDVSSLTPMFQLSNHGRAVPKSQHPTRRHLASTPESQVLSPSEMSPQSPQTSDGNYSLMNVRGSPGLVLHDQELDYQIGKEVYPLSPRWDGLSDIHDLTSLLNYPLSRASSSKALRPELSQESGSSSHGSLHWRNSPMIPNVHFSGNKFVTDPGSNNKLYNVPEDETPHILKETCSPKKAVKTSSPNKKRVSPPHNCLHELRGSSSSPSLRGGRKFILQSVPSFPHSVKLKKV
ncbi:CRC domain-containing protein [Cinnamomum micranthum f. kanehirae]|uniref:CRC domain-containing protein n=1 Tax=Cinnamomum micranthum f. kanehirae TaxID=337451 RepID=A0A443N1J1_9MAGN|nr:CRC domain-containing protein [Cinnamomum micranthum f. kanehirae]